MEFCMPHFFLKRWDADGLARSKRRNIADLQHAVCSLPEVNRGCVKF